MSKLTTKTIIPADKNHLKLPLKEKLELTKQILEEAKKLGQPIVGLSGGLHSSLLFALAMENGINEAYHVELNLSFPEQRQYIENLKRNGAKIYEYKSPYNEQDFIKQFGLPCFKGLQNILPRSEWQKYGLTDACRKVRNKLYTQVWREHKDKVYLLGMLADEKMVRYRQWLQTGYLYIKDGKYFAKPIAHLTIDEAWQLAQTKIPNYPFHLYMIGNKYMRGDLGCWLCTVRMLTREGGNLTYLYDSKRELWRKLMFEYGLADILVKIWRDKKDSKLEAFLQKHDLLPIGMDMDGVICEKLTYYSTKTERDRQLYQENMKTVKSKLLFEALDKNVYIITGRRIEDKPITEEWLKKYGAERLGNRIFYMPYPRTFDNMVKFKAEMIRQLQLTKYFEDDKRIAEKLKKQIPECEIILVE